MKKVLTIAGSDSGAGAGIQADLKAISSEGVYATTAITSITAQNTLGVQNIFDLPTSIIRGQINSVMKDIGAEIIKIGMLSSVEIIEEVSNAIRNHSEAIVVADPVMIAKGGSNLLQDNAVKALKEKILDKAYLITPNIPEAEVLSGIEIKSQKDIEQAGYKILEGLNCQYLLIKGGHLEGDELTDVLFRNNSNKAEKILELKSQKVETKNTHGTGCTYASLISANLAKDLEISDAVQIAHKKLNGLIERAPKNIGQGHGPLWHFKTKNLYN